jgi:hypothetical protein
MSTTDVHRYLENIKHRPIDTIPVEYVPVVVDAMRAGVAELERRMQELPPDEAAALAPDLEAARAELLAQEAENPSIKFVMIKPTAAERELAAACEKDFNRRVTEMIKTHSPHLRESYESSVTNAILMNSFGEVPDDLDAQVKAELIETILEREGFAEAQLEGIPDDHPELALTEEERLEITLPEHAVGIDALEAQIEMSEREEAIREAKRAALLRRNRSMREARQADLSRMKRDQLISKLVYSDIIEQAREWMTKRLLDWMLYLETCNPERPIKRGQEVVGYEKSFPSIDALTLLRQVEDPLYEWLVGQHEELNIIPGIAQLREVAAFEPFRRILETLPGGRAGADSASDL